MELSRRKLKEYWCQEALDFCKSSEEPTEAQKEVMEIIKKELNTTGRFIDTYFCGCGNPEQAWEALRTFLELFEERDSGSWVLNLERYNKFKESSGIGVAHLLLYLMSGAGVIEHGGSVFGFWLTGMGQELREEVLTGSYAQFEGEEE